MPSCRPVGRDSILLASLEQAVDDLRKKLGYDMDRWQYGQAAYKHAYIRHPLSGALDEEMRRRFDVGPAPRGGYSYTVNNTGGGDIGRAYVYSGQTGGLLWTFTGEAAGDALGFSVSGAGDVNNDGYDDLIAGAYNSDAGGANAGRAYVYSGQTAGVLWTFTGEATGDQFGGSVSGAGDVDNDGYADLIIGGR